MRSREEINKDLKQRSSDFHTNDMTEKMDLTLEVLLDIRELLQKSNDKLDELNSSIYDLNHQEI